MEHSKPRGIKGIIVIVILILVLIGLGVLAWIYRDQLTGSAATLNSSAPTVGAKSIKLYANKDIAATSWQTTPSTATGKYYTLIDETTVNTTDYLSTTATGSNNLQFGFKAPTISQITVNVYAKSGCGGGLRTYMSTNIGFGGSGWQKAQTSVLGYTCDWTNYQAKFTGSWTVDQLKDLQVKISAWGSAGATISSIKAKLNAGVALLPNKDIATTSWTTIPSTPKGSYYTLIDETTANTSDYLTTTATGSNNLQFGFKAPTISQITVNVYAKSGCGGGLRTYMSTNIGFGGSGWQKAQTSVLGYTCDWTNYQAKFTGSWTVDQLKDLQVKISAWGAAGATISSIISQVM